MGFFLILRVGRFALQDVGYGYSDTDDDVVREGGLVTLQTKRTGLSTTTTNTCKAIKR